jgi:serine/threonine-protein kinase
LKRCPKCASRYRDGVERCPFDHEPLEKLVDPLIGRTIGGRYVVEEPLGAGGMATVYRGRHQALERTVALKVLQPKLAAQAEHRERFLREARAANRVHHEHVVDIVDIGQTEDGVVYLVMEYLRGRSLDVELEDGALSLARACRIGHQIALALGRAHELGVVHRDVKPGNVFLLLRDRDPDFVKLLDFGLARSLGDVELTKSNSVFGTPHYMAPEQIEGLSPCAQTDLYALGCVLFEMLSGTPPFDASTPTLLYHHVYTEAPRLRERCPSVPPALDALVQRMLEKRPERRPASALEVADQLGRLLVAIAPGSFPPSTASSQPARRALQHGSFQDAEQLWDAHIAELARRAGSAYAGRPTPPWLLDTLERMRTLVEQVRAARGQLRSLAHADTGKQAVSRGTALRLGGAIENLAREDSRVGERLTSIETDLPAAERALEEQSLVLLDALERGLTPVPALLQRWAQAKRAVHALTRARDAAQRERDDLRFQISQLKGRLGALEAAQGQESQAEAERDSVLDAEIRARIYALRLEAERVADHLAELKGA